MAYCNKDHISRCPPLVQKPQPQKQARHSGFEASSCSLKQLLTSYNLSVDLQNFNACNIVVVTALFGATDILRPSHGSTYPNVCYFAFLDQCTIHKLDMTHMMRRTEQGCLGMHLGWCIILVKHMESDLRVVSRLFKLPLPMLFPHANYSIWADGKSQLRVDPVMLISTILWANNADIGHVAHWVRYSLYDEQEQVLRQNLADSKTIAKQRAHYISQNIPSDYGLIDGTLIVRDHRSKLANAFACTWYKEYLKFPPRDQTSFPYVAYKLHYVPSLNQSEFLKRKRMTIQQKRMLGFYYSNKHSHSRIYAIPYCQYRMLVQKHRHAQRHGMCADEHGRF